MRIETRSLELGAPWLYAIEKITRPWKTSKRAAAVDTSAKVSIGWFSLCFGSRFGIGFCVISAGFSSSAAFEIKCELRALPAGCIRSWLHTADLHLKCIRIALDSAAWGDFGACVGGQLA